MRQRGTLKLDHRTWRLQLRVRHADGRTTWKSVRLGTKAELPTKGAARAAADRYLDHTDPKDLDPGAAMDWSRWCDRFIQYHLAMQASGTKRTKRSIIDTHLRQAFDGPLHKIDRERVRDWIVAQHEAGAAPSTIEARFAVLRRMLRVAVEEKLAATPPTLDQFELPKDEEIAQAVRQKAFTVAEFKRIVEASTLRDATAYALGRYIGLRGSEICGLTWQLVDLVSGTVNVRQQALDGELRPLKSKGSQTILAAPPELLEHLLAYRARFDPSYDGFLFPDAAGKPETSQALRERLHATLEQLGIRRRGLHGLRHLCAIAMADSAVNPEAIRRAMRHSSLRVTAVYLAVSAEDIAAGLARGALGSIKGEVRPQQHPTTQATHVARPAVVDIKGNEVTT